MPERNERIEYFDIARGIGIILVIIMHTQYISDGVRGYITNFDMPLFFVVSGMLIYIKKESERDIKELFKKKLKTFLVPYAWFSVLLLIIHAVNIYLGYFSKEEFIRSLIRTVILYGDSILWFLPTLLLGEMLAIFLLNRFKEIKTLIVLLVATVVIVIAEYFMRRTIPFGTLNLFFLSLIDFLEVPFRGITAGLFVCFGYFFSSKKGALLQADTSKRRIINLLVAFVFLILLIPISLLNGPADFHRLVFNNPILYFACAILGSLGVIFLSSGIKSLFPLAFIGKNSLIIMCTHLDFYVLFGAIQISWLIDAHVSRAKSYIFMFNIVLFTLLIEIPIILLINHVCPFVIGRSRSKNAGK